MAEIFLGIDLGTSGARAIVIDRAEQVLGTGKSAISDHVAGLRSPAAWWAATQHALRTALAGVASQDVVALGQAERVLCIDDSPAHDIAGRQAAGFATALVRTGLHADLSDTALLEHCRSTAVPDFILPHFSLEGP